MLGIISRELKYIFYIIILGFFLSLNVNVSGQSSFGSFVNYGRYEGVYHTGINSIIEDSKGFIWIGTSDGLMRTDGIFFDTFSKNNTFSSSLSDNTINCIEEDINKKVLWIGTSIGGINRFNMAKKDSVNFYIEPDSLNTRGFVSINSICQIDSAKFIVGTQYQGAYFFYPKQGVFIKLQDVCHQKFDFPKTIYKIHKGNHNIWICTSKGILQFDLHGVFLNSYFFQGNHFLKKPSNNNKSIIQVKEIDENNIEFISEKALYTFNWQRNKLNQLYQANEKTGLSCFEKDAKGYWLGTKNQGLIYYNKIQNKITNYHKNNVSTSIPNDIIKDLKICQHNSILWVATRDGLAKYDYHKSKFLQFNIEDLTNDELNSVYSLAKDSRGNYWVNGAAGFFRKTKYSSEFSKVNEVGDKYVLRIFEDFASKLWMLSNKGLIKYDLTTDQYRLIEFKFNNYSLSDLNFISDYASIKGDSNLWLISKVGLIKFNLSTEEYEVFPMANPEEISNYRYTSLQFSKNNDFIWIGSRRGDLIKFDVNNKSYKKVNVRKIKGNKYKPCIILDLAVDSLDNVWMATFGSGLLLYNENTNKVSYDLAKDVLESYVYGIIDDGKGHFWISSNQGIVKLNKKDNTTKLYNKGDGTFCSEFNDGSYFRALDGNLLFGGINGFIEFDPDGIYKNKYIPKVYISSYSENNSSTNYGEEILDDVRYDVDSVITVQGDSEIKLFVSVINYSLSNDNKIKWKLEGYDEDWKEGYAFETLNYSNLKKGSFKLRVKGINNDGVESKDDAILIINVKAKLVDTYVFQLFLVLLIFAIIMLLIRINALWQKSQKALLVEKVKEQTEELIITNKELEESRNKIFNQKTELEIHRNYLEEIVELRTSDLEEAKQKAEESDKLKTSFLANLSHEIRTPMNAIIGFSNLLLTDEFETDQQKHFINVINQSSESLLALINDIIDISRIETGNIELVKQETHIPKLIKEVADELVFEQKGQDVRFIQSYELAKDDLDLYIDRHRLKQIVSNLLRNAFKFTAEGYVKITVKSVDKEMLLNQGFYLNGVVKNNFKPILFVIEDSGIGIKEEDQKIIFEPFQKAQNKKKLYDGMGLGLSIVRNLVDLFGGDVIVKSEYKKGTTFCFYINKSDHYS